MTINHDLNSFYTEASLAKKLSVSKPLLRKWRRLGAGPRFFKMGRCVRYSPQDVANWLKSQCVTAE